MAVSYTLDQYDTVSRLKVICATILDQLAEARKITSEAVDKGYSPGVAVTGITDALLNGNGAPFPNLTAADVTAAVAALTSIDTALAASSRTGFKALAKMR